MNESASSRARDEAAAPDLWRSIPFECILSGLAILLAAGLKFAGLMP
ncbi:hypothetical protein Q8W71_17480 [Methylobacterium sp. NEAU 140]|nr:hypothetical protein [Methylobacterium sp. NEAU 140]MDP4024420.1 hypothetical protein [Methylobacterium sp. NEAU 140]